MMMGSYMMMDNWSAMHWIIFTIVVAVFLYPIGRILRRIGLSPFWSVLALIPLVNIFGLWALALIDWPRDKSTSE